jgi:hypothetical protein
MKKYPSRKKNRVALILLSIIAFLMIIGCLCSSRAMMLAAMVLLIPFSVLYLSMNRCPHCGEFFRGLYWSRPNAGHCVKCGEIITFDDSENDD